MRIIQKHSLICLQCDAEKINIARDWFINLLSVSLGRIGRWELIFGFQSAWVMHKFQSSTNFELQIKAYRCQTICIFSNFVVFKTVPVPSDPPYPPSYTSKGDLVQWHSIDGWTILQYFEPHMNNACPASCKWNHLVEWKGHMQINQVAFYSNRAGRQKMCLAIWSLDKRNLSLVNLRKHEKSLPWK